PVRGSLLINWPKKPNFNRTISSKKCIDDRRELNRRRRTKRGCRMFSFPSRPYPRPRCLPATPHALSIPHLRFSIVSSSLRLAYSPSADAKRTRKRDAKPLVLLLSLTTHPHPP